MSSISTENLKVLYSIYPAAFQVYGGAEIQLLKTKEYLERIGGCEIKLFDMFTDRLDQYDILHTFYMHPDILLLCQIAKRKGVKLALSPIYWRTSEKFTNVFGPTSLARFYSNVKHYKIPTFLELFPFKDLLELADIILPNSEMEAVLLSRDFRINPKKFCVVPNGVDEEFASAEPNLFIEKHGITDFVLYAARIMKRKNPLGVMKICKALKIPLVLVGQQNPREEEYFEECKKIEQSSENIKMIGFLPHDSEELRSAYAAAKVFVLPSNFETPGLSALEAAVAGCNLVVTNQGSTEEYFGEHAWYVNPWSAKDLETKIKEAYDAPKSGLLRKRILENYTWDKVAEKTLDAYKSILSQDSKR
jgi:glycosyltransferase involved in cell wall biosynthesis